MTTEVSRRADDIHLGRVPPEEDNMLRLCTDCRTAAFDWESFRGEPVADEHSPLAVAADRIAAVYALHVKQEYLTPAGYPHPRPGAFQIAFSDLGTPKADQTSAYERLRQMLVDRGVPREKIGIIHEHDQNDESKARFFSACRDGRYAVAITSTSKMGMGTNVQDRMVALHHLSVPWRPSDVEQREGRILRPGNQHKEVEVFVYATERSFSVFGWQTLERKAGFIGQLLRADPSGPRVIEVTDDEALSYGEVKALSTGDQTFVEVAALEDRIGRLERLQRSHSTEQAALARRERTVVGLIGTSAQRRDALVEPAARVREHADDPWRIEIDGHTFDNQGDAARALGPQLRRYQRPGLLVVPGPDVRADWVVQTDGSGFFRLDVGAGSITVPVERRDHDGLMGVLRRVTNQVADIPLRHEQAGAEVEQLTAELDRVRAKIGVPFSHADELRESRRSLAHLQEVLAERYAPPSPDPPSPVSEPERAPAEADHRSAERPPVPGARGASNVRALLAVGTDGSRPARGVSLGPGSAHVSATEAAQGAASHRARQAQHDFNR